MSRIKEIKEIVNDIMKADGEEFLVRETQVYLFKQGYTKLEIAKAFDEIEADNRE